MHQRGLKLRRLLGIVFGTAAIALSAMILMGPFWIMVTFTVWVGAVIMVVVFDEGRERIRRDDAMIDELYEMFEEERGRE